MKTNEAYRGGWLERLLGSRSKRVIVVSVEVEDVCVRATRRLAHAAGRLEVRGGCGWRRGGGSGRRGCSRSRKLIGVRAAGQLPKLRVTYMKTLQAVRARTLGA